MKTTPQTMWVNSIEKERKELKPTSNNTNSKTDRTSLLLTPLELLRMK